MSPGWDGELSESRAILHNDDRGSKAAGRDGGDWGEAFKEQSKQFNHRRQSNWDEAQRGGQWTPFVRKNKVTNMGWVNWLQESSSEEVVD